MAVKLHEAQPSAIAILTTTSENFSLTHAITLKYYSYFYSF